MTSYLTYSPISPMMTNFIWKVSKFPSSFCIIKQNTSPLVTFDTFIWAAIAQQSTHEYGRINHVNLKRNDTITTKKTSTRKPVYIYMMWYMVHAMIFIPVQTRGITVYVTAVNIYDMHHIFSFVFAATLWFICAKRLDCGYHKIILLLEM